LAFHFYVYYAVDPAAVTTARGRVARFLEAIREVTGARGRLLHRADEPLLWMEIFENVSDRSAFASALERLSGVHALSDLLAPGRSRHVECFED
jgi:hypothetical protein